MTYLATTLYINKLYQEQGPKIALGEEGIAERMYGGIKDLVLSHWDPTEKLASIMSFLGPGILLKMSMPWMAVAYEVAGALGVNWTEIWAKLGHAIYDLIVETAKKPLTEEEAHDKIADKTESIFSTNTTDTIDKERLTNAAKLKVDDPIPASKAAKGANISLHFTKQAGIAGSALKSRGLLTGFFKKVIPWLAVRALSALKLIVPIGAAAGLLGIKPGPKKDGPGEDGAAGDSTSGAAYNPSASTFRDPIHKLPMSASVSPALFEFKRNDDNATWVERGNINDIESTIGTWISSAYPQLMQDQEKDKLMNSPAFIEVVKMFDQRNKGAQILPIYVVPKPFERKIDIVAFIVNKYLKTRGK